MKTDHNEVQEEYVVEEAKVVILACAQAVPEPAVLQRFLEEQGLKARVVTEPCSSKVEAYQLLRLLANGADLVWVVGCPEERCRLAEGSTRMGFRVEYARQYLQEIGLEPERLGYTRLAALEKKSLEALSRTVRERQQQLGPKFGTRSPERESS